MTFAEEVEYSEVVPIEEEEDVAVDRKLIVDWIENLIKEKESQPVRLALEFMEQEEVVMQLVAERWPDKLIYRMTKNVWCCRYTNHYSDNTMHFWLDAGEERDQAMIDGEYCELLAYDRDGTTTWSSWRNTRTDEEFLLASTFALFEVSTLFYVDSLRLGPYSDKWVMDFHWLTQCDISI